MRKPYFKAIAAAAAIVAASLSGIAATGGTVAHATVTARAATPSCGGGCIEFYAEKFGPNFITDSFKQAKVPGTPIILFQKSNNDPALDFTYAFQGTVSDLYAAHLVSAAVNLHYGSDEAFEFEYSPLGAGTSQCIGITSVIPGNGTKVALEPCGTNGGTVWILDSADVVTHGSHVYYPFINGSDTNFSDPYVLNYPGGVYPTDKPRPQLTTWQLGKYSDNTPWDNQAWGVRTGPEN